MKKLLFLTLLVLLAFTSGLLAAVHIGVNAGYSYATLDDMKAGFQAVKTQALAASKTAKVSDFGTSVFANFDLDIGLTDVLTFGPRSGVQYVFPVELNTDIVDSLTNTKITYSAFLIPIMLGANVNLKIPITAVQLTIGGFAGYGIAFVNNKVVSASGFVAPYDVKSYNSVYQGGGLMYEASGAFEIFLANFFTISINLGYRVAKFSNLRTTNKVEIAGHTIVSQDQLLTDATGQTRTVDFSGFNGGIGLNLRF
ncbi:MAG: hypothetical protein WCJ94_07170 [bacterium]